MGFKNQAVPTPGSNSGLRKKFARFRPERHFPRSAGWEGPEVLILIRTVCSQLMGFAKACMTQPGFEPATFAFQTAAKTARLRELLLLTRATISEYIRQQPGQLCHLALKGGGVHAEGPLIG